MILFFLKVIHIIQRKKERKEKQPQKLCQIGQGGKGAVKGRMECPKQKREIQ